MRRDIAEFRDTGDSGHLSNEDLGDWYGGQITDPIVCTVIQDHLDRCKQCSARLAFLEAVLEEPNPARDSRLQQVFDPASAEATHDLLIESGEQESLPWWKSLHERLSGNKWPTLAPVGAVVAVAIFLLVISNRHQRGFYDPEFRGDPVQEKQFETHLSRALKAEPLPPFRPPSRINSSIVLSKGPEPLQPVNTSVLSGTMTFTAQKIVNAQSYQLMTYTLKISGDLLPFRTFLPAKEPEVKVQHVEKVFPAGQWYAWRMVAKMPDGHQAVGQLAAFRGVQADELQELAPPLTHTQKKNKRILILRKIEIFLKAGMPAQVLDELRDYPQDTDTDGEHRAQLRQHILNVHAKLRTGRY